MKTATVVVLFFVFVFSLSAANYIDNPNFDTGAKSWAAMRSDEMTSAIHEIVKDAEDPCVKRYQEHTRQGIIRDQYLVPQLKIASYVMKDVPEKLPLSFLVEVGLEGDNPLNVKVELVEVYKRKSGRISCDAVENDPQLFGISSFLLVPPALEDCRFQPREGLLSVKTLEFADSGVWHLIISDYPAYKKHEDSKLELRIERISENGILQINYAQVGSDPKALGGRGARKKNFNKKD